MDTQICSKCKEMKSAEEFSKMSKKSYECRSCYNKYMNDYYHKNKGYRDKMSEQAKIRRESDKYEAMQHYCQGEPKCECCGITEPLFLSIDHINGDGKKDRLEGRHGAKLCKWLRENGYPDGYRVLCINCNFAIGIHGKCPHKE